MFFVPVVDKNQKPLMPTTILRAKRWIASGKATPFWKRGVFCVRLNEEPSGRETQEIAVGIDPGAKREGFSIKSESHTYFNIQATAVTWVKDAVEVRRNMRRSRRFRKTPCRQNRMNRTRGCLPPSTKARWQWKLRIANWLCKMFPVTTFIVEDIKAWTKGQRKWDVMFSPLEVGKQWFYSELQKFGNVITKPGHETHDLRLWHGLRKVKNKTAECFEAHCVDSWVLANSYIGGHIKPDNTDLLCITPLRFHRRQLHRLQPTKNNNRFRYGGTRSFNFKRGCLIKHPKFGLKYVGGFSGNRITLHSILDGGLVCRTVNPTACTFLTYNSWRGINLSVIEANKLIAA